jgi:hypothetical protein
MDDLGVRRRVIDWLNHDQILGIERFDELLSRELGVTASALAGWRDDFQAGGQAALKGRPTDDRDLEIARMQAKVGEPTMDNELLLQRCRGDHPFVLRRRRS